MQKFNKIISGALAALMIFTSVPIYATNDFSSEITSEITSEETSTETTSSEITTENNSETSSETVNDNSEESSETEENDSSGSTEVNGNNSEMTSSGNESTDETSNVESSEKSESTSEEISSETDQSQETDQSEISSDESLNILSIDDEGEEEINPLDGWTIDLKLYDQDENNGLNGVDDLTWEVNPPLGEYNENYKETETKTIHMQINYNNNHAIKDYEPGELSFVVPNLGYNVSTSKVSVAITNGANDSSHTGYEWNFTGYDKEMNKTYSSPSQDVAYMVFSNANKIEAQTTCEGSIKITYKFTSNTISPSPTLDETIYSFEKNFNSQLMTNFTNYKYSFRSLLNDIEDEEIEKIKDELDYDNTVNDYYNQIDNIEKQISELVKNLENSFTADTNTPFITSPNYPDKYPNNMSEKTYYDDISVEENNIVLKFTSDSKLESSPDYIIVTDNNTGKQIDKINGNTLSSQKIFVYETNNIRLGYHSDSSAQYQFKAYIWGCDDTSIVQQSQQLRQYNLQIEELEEALDDFDADFDDVVEDRIDMNELSKLVYETIAVDSISTNNIIFNYTRTYKHPWQKGATYTLEREALAIESYDGLPSNSDEYIWVKYKYYTDFGITRSSYPYLYVDFSNGTIYENLPNNVLIISPRGNTLSPNQNGQYELTWSETYNNDYGNSETNIREIYVGYPKTIYNEENNNLNISNTAELWGYYGSSSAELEYLDECDISIDLSDFDLKNEEKDIAAIDTSFHFDENFYYQNIIEDKDKQAIVDAYIYPQLNYSGNPLTFKVGQDVLYCTSIDGGTTRLTDNDYYLTEITFPELYNRNWMEIPDNKYNCELWIRRAGNSNYTLYESFTNKSDDWSFSKDDAVVGYYFIIYDLYEGLTSSSSAYNEGRFDNTIRFKKPDIPERGTLYNLCFVQVYERNEDGELEWINSMEKENYTREMLNLKVDEYDKSTYNDYVQRAIDTQYWTYYNVTNPNYKLYTRMRTTAEEKIIQDETNQQFLGEYEIAAVILNTKEFEEDYITSYDSSCMISGYTMYDLLPKGVTLVSTEEDIIKSLKNSGFAPGSGVVDQHYFRKTGEKLDETKFIEMLKNNIKVTITENWNGTGRTHVKVNLQFDEPLFIRSESSSLNLSRSWPTVTLKYSFPYDSYIEYGDQYTNYVYADWYSDTYAYSDTNGVVDNGINDPDAIDINENGETTDKIDYCSALTKITSVISTFQNVQVQAESSLSNYSIGIVPAEYGKEYSYKLRARTGQNDITNLVIYDNLERWTKDINGNFVSASGKKKFWQGEFLGIDTSYAESKGYTVKVWYSEDEKAGTLAEDTSWKEYTDSVDTAKVKSLAFQYLDSNGDPAIIPANNLTYVLINMRAPADESITTLAYNACWTQWNAIDTITGDIVDSITGITSNTVKVALPNSIIDESTPSIELNIQKEIQGTNEEFKNLGLDPEAEYIFKISLVKQEANEDGTHDIVNALLSSKDGLSIKNLNYGSWLITEIDDNYFDFVDIVSTIDEEILVEGVKFEKTEDGYLLTISEDVDTDTIYSLKVINQIEPEKFFEENESKQNIFQVNTTVAEQSFLDKLIEFFK